MTKQSEATELAEVRRLAASGEAQSIRENARLRRAEMARSVGVTQAAFTRWETGERTPTGPQALTWLRLLRALRAANGGA